MDDVIFAGSESRPGRNRAEVTLFIDNSARTAPAEFNDSDALEVTRRIEREAGSAYRVNNKDARARDIRLLFEDAATGARSPALVRQGRIGEIVNAPPQERRRVLEDAAGIAGLHSRRHEAELRLKAAEGNLERLGDIIGQLSSQLQALRRQARQAQRYREISGKIREVEALQHHLHWVAACAHVEQEEAAFQEALGAVAQETKAEGEALRQQAEAAEKLQPLRDEEAARAAVLHRLSVERDALEREEARAKARQAELETRLAQASRDLAREEEHIGEAEGMLRGLAEEGRRLTAASSRDLEEPQLREAVTNAAEALAAAEQGLNQATGALAQARAERHRLETTQAELKDRLGRLEAEANSADRGACQTRSGACAPRGSCRAQREGRQPCKQDRACGGRACRRRGRGREGPLLRSQGARSRRNSQAQMARAARPSSPRCSSCSSPPMRANGLRSSSRFASPKATNRPLARRLATTSMPPVRRRLPRIGV